ncbi:unnamed protein product [Brassica napus]|uniref:(rape) hypothetical protein n=1 Tax=Brassica napus TaxID=3708 RepID=A0A816ZCR5_BRANA|nr:unnamed protein product [Brassica napus]
MHALFSRRFVVVVGSSSSQLTKSLMKKKLAFSHSSQSRHILSHLPSSSFVTRFVPSLLSLSEKAHGSGSLLEARAGFFYPQLPPPKPWVFTGFQKRGWKSCFNGANGVVFGLIIANAAVFTMWKVYDREWMIKNFALSLKSFMTGRIHTLITSGFTNVGTSQLIMNMIGLYYFGTRIARTLGPVYLLKLYIAGSLAGSLLFLSAHAVMAILKSQGVSYKGQSKPIGLLGPQGSVYAIALLDMCLYPKVTTYFAFICRVPVMLVILSFENKVLKVLDGEQKSITAGMIHAVGGAMVAAIAWRRIKKANAAVFAMWNVYDKLWMVKNFVLSLKTLMTGRIHTLITSGFSNVDTSQLILNMFGVYYFGSSIARTLGPVYLLKLYFAGTLAGSLLFVSVHGVMAILKSYMVSFKDQSKLTLLLGAEGPVYAITLLDICLYPKVSTYFAFIFRVPIMINFPALSPPKRKNLSFVFSRKKMRWERVRRQNQQVGLGDSSSGPGKRWGHTCNAVKGGRFVYVFGGFGRDDCLTNQVHVFDAGTQIWTKPVIRGVPPSPRDSHSCTTVGDHLFVFGGTDGKNHLNDLHVLDTSSHTWKCVDVRGEGPEAREAHSATLVGKRIFIFGGCGKASGSGDEVFYNDLYTLNTETLTWQRAVTAGNPPSARDSHTCSTWKNKIIVVGGEDLDDYYYSDVHILDTETFEWKQMKTSGQVLTPRAGHVTVALERNLFVFGGFTDSQNLYDDLYVLDVETGVWSKLVHAMEEGPSARFSAGAVSLGPYKAGSFFFVGGCNKNLEPLDDIYYLHTDGGYNARFDHTPGRFSLRKQMKLKCQAQKLAVAGTSTNQGVETLPMSIGSMYQGKTVFHARVTENVPLGYSIETIIDGKVLRGFLFSNRQSSVQTVDPSVSSGRKRPAMSDADCDHGAKSQRTLSEDAAGSSQQAGPVDPSDDANKKVADSNVMDTSMIEKADANVNIVRQQEAETAAVASDVKDQDPSQLNMDGVNAEPSPVNLDQGNVEPLSNEMSTDVDAATEAGPGGDSSPQNQDEGTVAAEDADADQKPQPH